MSSLPLHVTGGGFIKQNELLRYSKRLHYHLKHGQVIFITWTPSIFDMSSVSSTILGFNLLLDSSVFIKKL